MKTTLRNTLTPLEEKILKNIINSVKNIPYIKQIIIFGSRIKGYSNEWSDLDIVIMTEVEVSEKVRSVMDDIKTRAIVDQGLNLGEIILNIVPVSLKELHTKPQIRLMLEEGIILWER
jgi:predicted nucleotidyltransferase